MQLIVIRMNKKGQATSSISASFNEFHEYFTFLQTIGVDVPEEDAIFEYLQGKAIYKLPLEALNEAS